MLNEWEADDGSKRSRHSGVGRVEFLGPKTAAADGERAEQAAA